MLRRSVIALACSLAPGLLALGLASACTEKEGATPPPAGMAGAGPAGTPTGASPGQPEGGRGFGVNPGGAPAGSPHGAASQPASQPAGQAPTGAASPHGAASQPAGGPGAAAPGAAPQVIRGGGQEAVPPPAPAKSTVTGEVTETVNAKGYTYMKVKTADGNDVWVAVGETQMTVGTKVTVDESVTMRDFHSPTLNRTFPSIIFGTLR